MAHVRFDVDQRPQGTCALRRPGRVSIACTSGLWPGLVRFLGDPKIPLDASGVERALRGVVVGRKNHYGSRSERGTRDLK